ncbi:MAG: hypothetical protein JST51_00820 [Armatimonadetes bacterium]|nr:hypothetical protein [Armatimonadota bacterium]
MKKSRLSLCKTNLRSIRSSSSHARSIATAGLVLLGLAGCGGSGTTVTASPFLGSWSGTYASTGESGTANVTINSSGSYTGSGFDNTTQLNYTVQGAITSSGVVTGTISEGGATGTLNGNWAINNGHLGGNVTISHNGVIGATNTYDMTLN